MLWRPFGQAGVGRGKHHVYRLQRKRKANNLLHRRRGRRCRRELLGLDTPDGSKYGISVGSLNVRYDSRLQNDLSYGTYDK